MNDLTIRERASAMWRTATGIFTNVNFGEQTGFLTGVLGSGGMPPDRGTKEQLAAYTTMPWVRAVAGKIAYAVAATEWTLSVIGEPKEEARNGTVLRVQDIRPRRVKALQRANYARRQKLLHQHRLSGELVELDDHPLLDLLHSANAIHTGLSLRKMTMLYLDLVGDSFWLKERNNVGAPVAIWPIPPHWVTSTPTTRNPTYRVSYKEWQRQIPEAEIFWMSDPNPVNPYGRGSGHTQSVADELETDEYAAKMIKQVFFNRARPDLLIAPKEGVLREEEVQRLEHGWTSRLQGFQRVMKPFFVKKAVEVKEFKHDFRSLQMKDLREHQRDIIMQVFGIPPEIMGVLTSSNRATIDSADYLFSQYVVVPRLEFLRTQMQERLVPEYDERLVLDYISPAKEDKEMQMNYVKLAPSLLTVDEWRERMGVAPMEDKDAGKLHMITPGVTFEEDIANIAEPIPPTNGFGRPAGENDDEFEEEREEREDEERMISKWDQVSDEDLVQFRRTMATIERT